MKRLLLVGLITALACSTPYAAEVYWDGTPPPDAQIWPGDFKGKYPEPSTTKSMKELEVYDYEGLPVAIEPEPPQVSAVEPEAVEKPRTRPTEKKPTVVTPEKQPTATVKPPTARTTREAPARTPKTPEAKPPAATVDPLQIQPREVIPQVETRRPEPVPAASPEEVPVEGGLKKIPWGKQEVTPSDTTKGKFQWGQPK